jgi:O-antigen/teichoic acid export membrane protein
MGLGYLIAIYISKFYGAEVFGRYSILVTFSQFSIMIFSLGIPIAIVKLTSEAQHFNQTPISNYLVQSAVVLFFSGLVGSLLIYSMANFFGYSIFHDAHLPKAFKYLSFFFVFLIFQNFGIQFLSGTKNFLAFSLSLFIFPNILFLSLILLFRSLQLVSEFYVLLSYLLSLSIVGIYLFFLIPLQKVSKEYPFKNLLRLSFPILLSSAFLSISSWTDIFMLGSMASKADVGVYSAAYKLATITLLVILTINIIIAPKIAELYHQNKIKQLELEVRNANRLMTYLTLPIVIVLLFFRKFFLGWFGMEFLSGELVLILLSFGFLVNAFCGTVTHILNMTNYQKILRNLTLAMAILNISLNYLLIPKFGINGAAAASLISQVFLNATAVYYVKKHLGFWALL